MTTADRIALVICLAAFLATAWVHDRVYERAPHIEDEMAFVWQARAIARGRLAVPSPALNPNSFLVPFVVDYQGQRFGKYPAGWPVVLAAGELLQARGLVNPALTAAAIWLVYRLGKKLIDDRSALLAAFLGAASPFVLLNGGSLLSHPWSLLLALIFITGWLDAFTTPNLALPPRLTHALPTTAAALALGLLALTRPWTAVGLALPFGLHGLVLLARGERAVRARLLGFGLLAGMIAALYYAWQLAVTGDPLLNPYVLWWPYDKIGFRPGVGLNPGGHNLRQALVHTQFSLRSGSLDLFGWPLLSGMFLPFGLYARRKDLRVWLVAGASVSLVAAYALYWTPSWVYGPRYYYEGLAGPLLLTAAGIRWVSGQPDKPWRLPGKLRFAAAAGLVGLLVMSNLLFYLPARLEGMRGLNGITAECTAPFETGAARRAAPVLVFVHPRTHFFEYACLVDLNDPFLNAPLILAISRGEEIDQAVARAFPGRRIQHYDPATRRLTSRPPPP
jgi:hypothetical protein